MRWCGFFSRLSIIPSCGVTLWLRSVQFDGRNDLKNDHEIHINRGMIIASMIGGGSGNDMISKRRTWALVTITWRSGEWSVLMVLEWFEESMVHVFTESVFLQSGTQTHQQPLINPTAMPQGYAYFYGGSTIMPGNFPFGAPATLYPVSHLCFSRQTSLADFPLKYSIPRCIFFIFLDRWQPLVRQQGTVTHQAECMENRLTILAIILVCMTVVNQM